MFENYLTLISKTSTFLCSASLISSTIGFIFESFSNIYLYFKLPCNLCLPYKSTFEIPSAKPLSVPQSHLPMYVPLILTKFLISY